MTMKVLVGCVIFENIKKYLKDFFVSLDLQNNKNFDLVIINDGVKTSDFRIKKNTKIIDNSKGLNPAQIRKFLIYYAIDNCYDILIFADADDIMSKDRIDGIIAAYKLTKGQYGFYYNNIFLLSNSKRNLFDYKMPHKIENYKTILKYNFLGMSNSSINIKKVGKSLGKIRLSNKILAFDWYIYTVLLLLGYSGIKTEGKTFYRIHENNIAGMVSILNRKKLRIGIKVKKYHYKALSNVDPLFKEYFNKIRKLELFLSNKKNETWYLELINKKFKNSVFWWENIKTLDELEEKNDIF